MTDVPVKKTPSSGRKLFARAVVVVAVLFLLSRCFNGNDGSSPAPPANLDVPVTTGVTYELISDSRATTADITLQTPGGGTSQQQGIDVPLTNKGGGNGLTYGFSSGDFVYFSAQISDPDFSGTITCRIVGSDGTVISTADAVGFPSIATCSGRAN